MNLSNLAPFPPNLSTPVTRSTVVNLIQASLTVGDANFARQAALAWLSSYPGDLSIGLFHAEALLQECSRSTQPRRAFHRYERPIAILQTICQTDPEFLAAQEMLARARFASHQARASEVEDNHQGENGSKRSSAHSIDTPTMRRTDIDSFGDLMALEGYLQPGMPVPEWSYGLRQARQALAQQKAPEGRKEHAEHLLHKVLLTSPSTPLAAVTHLLWETYRDLPLLAVRNLAQVYHDRWPNCVQFLLILADSWMDSGESERAVGLLHQAVALDVTGQVAKRMWGKEHPYLALWPEQLEAPILQNLPVPAAVAAALGWNQLPTGLPLPEPTNMEPAVSKGIDRAVAESPLPLEEILVKTLPLQTIPLPPRRSDSGRVKSPAASRPTSQQAPGPEVPVTLQTELERLASRLNQPQLGRLDGRFPVYVIFTTRRGLHAQYGAGITSLIEEEMLRLVEAVRMRRGWSALLFYADEGLAFPTARPLASLSQSPARYNDPWSLKLALADLDAALGTQGEMIGALLIVGGHEVVPFHHLPNPVDDIDGYVPSDNPYATRDENYFIPEWPVGRLPGGQGSDPGLLLGGLEEYTARHQEGARPKPWTIRVWDGFKEFWQLPSRRLRPSLGYTAAVWKQASISVFKPVGKGRGMLVSPPLQAGEPDPYQASGSDQETHLVMESTSKNGKNSSHRHNHVNQISLRPSRLGYFNLHGLPDAVEWFGQRDSSTPSGDPDYPVALRPQNIKPRKNGDQVNYSANNHNHSQTCSAPHIVFTEACYGAHILGKGVEEALALKFLATGSQAVVGATCISYGAIAEPLTAADLLGHTFWKSLGKGLPAGEALRRAKIHLAREMHRRQGYLDGEDQKTLISFVLYGDPLAQPLLVKYGPKTILRPVSSPAQVKTVCDRYIVEESKPVPPEVMRSVKRVVAQYLPGMDGAQVRLCQETSLCKGENHQCPTSQMGAKTRPANEPHRKVVTLQKSIPTGTNGSVTIHHRYARLTLDAAGRLVKLVVSR